MCVLTAREPLPAAIRHINAREAFLETNARPPLGAAVSLSHPEAGEIAAYVRAVAEDGITIAFAPDPRAVAFALAAIAADMSEPG